MIKFDHLKERGPVRNVRKMVNDLREEVRSLRIANGKNYAVRRTAIGQILEIKAGTKTTETAGVEIKRFQITEVKPTYLVCLETNYAGTGFANTTSVKVLRPYSTLLNDTSNGMSGWAVSTTDTDMNLERTLTMTDASNLTYTWVQNIYPAYLYSSAIGEGDWIYAAKGITGFSATDSGSPAAQIDWVDLNVDGRTWAFTTSQKVSVCVNGETKYMHFIASGIGS